MTIVSEGCGNRTENIPDGGGTLFRANSVLDLQPVEVGGVVEVYIMILCYWFVCFVHWGLRTSDSCVGVFTR